MEVFSSLNGAVMKLVLAICYCLLLLVTQLQADSSSSSSSEAKSEEDYNILTILPKGWYDQYSPGYPETAGGTAQEETESDSESESGHTSGNSFDADGGSIPNTDMQTGQSSTVFISASSSDNVTPYRTTTTTTTTKIRTSVHIGGNEVDDDSEVDDKNDDNNVDEDSDDGEENETDNGDNGEEGGTVPTTTMTSTTMTPDCGNRKFLPLLPISGRHCFKFPDQPNGRQRPCQCSSPPPKLPAQLQRLANIPSQVKRSRRRQGDCDILCIGWILSFVGVLIGAVYKVSKNRTTHF